MENIHSYLRKIPLFKNHEKSAIVERLGGLTNLVFRIELDGEKYVLRIPGQGSENLVDRIAEKQTLQQISKCGITAELHYYDDDSIMVTKFIPGTTASPKHFTNTPGAIERAARVIKSVHQSDQVFKNKFRTFDFIAEYQMHLRNAGVLYPDGFGSIIAKIKPIEQALTKNPVAFLPSHCDLACENFIDDGMRTWLVDWEFSAMNDPMWDLSYLSVEGNFTPAQDQDLMGAYFGTILNKSQQGRFVVYKSLCLLISMLWEMIQQANGNPADDFKSAAQKRFKQCKKVMDSPEFANYVAAI